MESSKSRPDCSELAKVLVKLFRNIAAREDVTSYGEAVKKMQALLPGLTREEVTDAIVSYSRFQATQVDPTIKKIQELLRIPKLEGALRERIEASLKRLEDGKERPLAEYREIKDEVIQDLAKTEEILRQREKDAAAARAYQEELTTGNRPAPKEGSTPRIPTKESEARADLKERVMVQRRVKQLEKEIAAIEKKIATGDLSITPDARAKENAAITGKKQELANSRKKLDGLRTEAELRRQIKENDFPKSIPQQGAATEIQSRIEELRKVRDAAKARGEKVDRQNAEIADLTNQLKTGEFKGPLPKKATARTEAEQKIADLRRGIQDAKGDKARVERLTKEIADVQRQLDSGKFDAPLEKKATVRNELEQRLYDVREERTRRMRENKKTERQDAAIADLKEQLRTGEFKEPLPPKQIARNQAEQEIADLRAEISDSKRRGEKTDRENAKIKDLEEQLRTGNFKAAQPPIQSAKTKLEARIAELETQKSAEISRGKKADAEAKEIARLNEQLRTGEFDEPISPKQGAKTENQATIAALKEDTEYIQRVRELLTSIDDLREQLGSHDVVEFQNKEEKTKDAAIERLEDELYYLKNEAKGRVRAQEKSTIKDVITSPFGLISALRFSYDASALGIQGYPRLSGNLAYGLEGLKVNGKAIMDGLRVFAKLNPSIARASFERNLRADPDYVDAKRAKLALTDDVHRDEIFFNRLANKIPGVKQFEAWHSTFLNSLRFNTFKLLKAMLFPDGNMSRQDGEAIANFINSSTGRANLKGNWGIAESMALSPRLYKARVQYLTGRGLWNPEVRNNPNRAKLQKAFLKSYAAHALAVATMAGIGVLGGADFEKDPRSSDFMKLKFGNRRIDIGSGMGQFATLAARIFPNLGGLIPYVGKTKSSATGVVSSLSGPDKPFFGRNTFDVIGDFARQRSAAGVGIAADLMTNEDGGGKPIDFQTPQGAGKYVGGLFLPLPVKDLYQIMTDDFQAPRDVALYAASLAGLAMQNHKGEDESIGTAAKKLAAQEYLGKNKEFFPLLKTLREHGLSNEEILSGYIVKHGKDVEKWEKDKADALANGQKVPTRPVDRTGILKGRLEAFPGTKFPAAP